MEAEQLYRDQRRSLFSIAYRMTGTVTEAEDIVQGAYLRLERARGRERASTPRRPI